MGAEADCTARYKGRSISGRARLETETLQFRGGDLKLSIPFSEMAKISAREGTLDITWAAGAASFDLGPAAAKWAARIQQPPTRLDKIGVKPDWKVSAVGDMDGDFLLELERAVTTVSVGRAARGSDAIFFGIRRAADLSRLPTLKAALKPNGALWTIRPKGRPEVSEGLVMAGGKAAGLVDVKVVRFSPTHTAEKFVIPVHARSAPPHRPRSKASSGAKRRGAV